MPHPYGSTVKYLEMDGNPVYVHDQLTVPLVLKNGTWEPEYDLEKFVRDSIAIDEEEFKMRVEAGKGTFPPPQLEEGT